MARPPSDNLTQREAEIMEILWREGSAAADHIRQELPDDPHDSTVRTLLRILETKGYVKHVVHGKAFVYRPAVRKASAERKAVGSIIKQFFGGSAEALVLRLIEDEQLTPEQLEQLRKAGTSTRRSTNEGGNA